MPEEDEVKGMEEETVPMHQGAAMSGDEADVEDPKEDEDEDEDEEDEEADEVV